MLDRAFGAREVDQHFGIDQRSGNVGAHGHAAGDTEEGGCIVAAGRTGRHVGGAGQLAIARGADRLDQDVPHAAARAGDRHLVDRGRLGHVLVLQRCGGSSGG